MIRLKTDRLTIISGTEELATAELDDEQVFGSLLNARVPPSWPPESLRDVRPMFLESCRRCSNCGPWTLGWYAVLGGADDVLCASVGFKGPPQSSTVEIGYSVVPEYQGRGFASEAVASISLWAFDQPGVEVVEAETEDDNVASSRVLEKTNFEFCGAGMEKGTRRYRLRRAAAQPGVATDGKVPPN